MSLDQDYTRLENSFIEAADGNPFEAALLWASKAESLRKASCGVLSAKEALQGALTGELPSDVNNRIPAVKAQSAYVKKYVELATRDIDDSDVRLSVMRSIAMSFDQHELIYVYSKNLSDGECSRVRVLCRMIWNNFYPNKEGNNAITY